MKSKLHWTTGKVLYLYFCGVLLGASVSLLVQEAGARGSLLPPLLGVVVALGLAVLPLAAARRG